MSFRNLANLKNVVATFYRHTFCKQKIIDIKVYSILSKTITIWHLCFSLSKNFWCRSENYSLERNLKIHVWKLYRPTNLRNRIDFNFPYLLYTFILKKMSDKSMDFDKTHNIKFGQCIGWKTFLHYGFSLAVFQVLGQEFLA